MKKLIQLLEISTSEFRTKIKGLVEVSDTSTSLLGGDSVKIPADGAHRGQSGWQSNNAWDIKASIGTPVYAVVGGTLKSYFDYGATPIKKDGKTLFGAGFTVDSDGGLPDVYYTHLKDVTVKQGDKVECGQLLGYVMDFPGSDYDHLHIGVETGHIRQFLNDDGTLKCSDGKITPSSSDSSTSGVSDIDSYAQDAARNFLGNLIGKALGENEIKKLLETNIKLGSHGCSNIDVDADISTNMVNDELLKGICSAANAAGVKVRITTAVSDHPSETNSGSISRHSTGNGVDISIINDKAVKDASNKPNVDKFVSQLEQLGYKRNSEGSNKKSVLWQMQDHYDHVHVSDTTGDSSDGGTSSTSTSGVSDIDSYAQDAARNFLGNLIGTALGENEIKKERIIKDIQKIKNLL